MICMPSQGVQMPYVKSLPNMIFIPFQCVQMPTMPIAAVFIPRKHCICLTFQNNKQIFESKILNTVAMPRVEKELLIFVERLRSTSVLSGVRFSQTGVFCVVFVGQCFYYCTFFWLLYFLSFFNLRLMFNHWFLQTILMIVL